MSEASTVKRLSKVATELNVGVQTVIDFLVGKGFDDISRNSKITDDMYGLLLKAYGAEKDAKEESKKIIQTRLKRETVALDDSQPVTTHRHDDADNEPEEVLVKNLNPVAERFKPEPTAPKKEVTPEPIVIEPEPVVTPVVDVQPEPVVESKPIEVDKTPEITADTKDEPFRIETQAPAGPKVLGTIDLNALNKGKGKKKRSQRPSKINLKLKFRK